jgi:hypothetical protein
MMALDNPEFEKLLQILQEIKHEIKQVMQEIKDDAQKSTLHEFLHRCHVYLSMPLSVQSKFRATGGTTTRVDGKYYPTEILPWNDFLGIQQRNFDILYDVSHPPSQTPLRVFDRGISLEDLGPNVCNKPLGSEKDLELYQSSAVQNPTTAILSALARTSHPIDHR